MFDVRQDSRLVERALLVAVERYGHKGDDPYSQLEELEELVKSIGVTVVDAVLIRIRKPNPKFLIGTGQMQEILSLAKTHECDVIVFDEELTPAQQRNWEEEGKMLVIDRQEVIIDIFAHRAKTKEAQLQVELAKMEYSLPRLRRAWTHLSRQRGGGVTQRGEGETQLEIDQRLVRTRIARLKKDLEEVIKHRKVQRSKRTKIPLPTAAIIGYTNAGKSSLLNHLTHANVIEEDKVFATLDPTSKRLKLPGGQTVILTDTVGFIRKLPHRLVDAFKATLEEAIISDLLIHVVDITHPDLDPFIETTLSVLKDLGAEENRRLLVFNKIDLLEDQERIQSLKIRFPDAVFTSTIKNLGLDELKLVIESIISEETKAVELVVPHHRYDLVNQLHEAGAVNYKQAISEGIYVAANVPSRLNVLVEPYQLNGTRPEILKQLRI